MMLPIFALGLAYGGFAALALAMGRHFEQVFDIEEPAPALRNGLRLAGALLLALSTWPCIAYWGDTSMGLGIWSALLTLAALPLVLLLPYWPRWAAGLGVAAPALPGLWLLLS
ncbi:membrane protein [Bordetella ansorpii]|uniref:Membrane protein n=1 Tax=Bordetella ansorpii TaxID=288768 RepID=A0A157PIS8_9BORD|nr:DUF3325 domain-containing protein [Bordetella ansorpii]SAI33286.1 membrane protein [Bordetella ansorpii]